MGIAQSKSLESASLEFVKLQRFVTSSDFLEVMEQPTFGIWLPARTIDRQLSLNQKSTLVTIAARR